MNVPGLVVTEGIFGFDETIVTLDLEMSSRGIKAVRIDHAASAAEAGLELPPTLLLVFGDPSLGTPLMERTRTLGIDLPLKILVWEESAQVFLAYNDPAWVGERHGTEASQPGLIRMKAILRTLIEAAAGTAVPRSIG